MGCRILGDDNGACFYDSVTMTPFAPIFSDVEEAEEFKEWLGEDPRGLDRDDLETKFTKFCEETEETGKI